MSPVSSVVEISLRLRQADQICEQLIRAVGPGRQLTPQPEAKIDPMAGADVRLDQRAELHAGIIRERIGHRDQIDVARIFLAEKIEPTLLHPSIPRGLVDFIGEVEQPIF